MYLNIVAHIKDKLRQWEIQREIEYQRLKEEYQERSKKFLSTMVDEMFRQDAEDEKEFGFTSLEFFRNNCKYCGDGRKTHREIMRERSLSGNHDLARQFYYECFRLMNEAWKRRERRKFWKRPPFRRKRTPEEREQEIQKLLPLIRILQPDDWQEVVEAMRNSYEP